MKNVLITGRNSYIGKNIECILKDNENFIINKVSVRDSKWQEQDFSVYDSIIHTAALVHNRGYNQEDYEEINVELTKDLAVKAKKEGVRYFIFMSTMGVYNQNNKFINKSTSLSPKTMYAKSKLDAEKFLRSIESEDFKVAILRPPLVYGYNSPGNYLKFSKAAQLLPLLPQFNNKRSMIYIKNLTEFIKLLLENEVPGTFFPQNKDYVNTSTLFKEISKVHSKAIFILPLTNFLVRVLIILNDNFKKIFDDFIYDKSLPGGPNDNENPKLINYNTVSFEKSIKETEGKSNEK